MKERLLDVLWFLEKMVRACFYVILGIYLAIKGTIIIATAGNIPDILDLPYFLFAILAGWLLAIKVTSEPSRRELREAKKKADMTEKILYEMVTEYQAGGLEKLVRRNKGNKV